MHLAISNESRIEAVVIYHRRVMGHLSGQGNVVEQYIITCKFPHDTESGNN